LTCSTEDVVEPPCPGDPHLQGKMILSFFAFAKDNLDNNIIDDLYARHDYLNICNYSAPLVAERAEEIGRAHV
jgi:hypothetical protein